MDAVHVPDCCSSRSDGGSAVVEQEDVSCVVESVLRINPRGDDSSTALHECLHYGMVYLMCTQSLSLLVYPSMSLNRFSYYYCIKYVWEACRSCRQERENTHQNSEGEKLVIVVNSDKAAERCCVEIRSH